jgi:homeobox protein cut-like
MASRLQAAESSLRTAVAELESRPLPQAVDALQREIQTLRSIAFATSEDAEEPGADADGAAVGAGADLLGLDGGLGAAGAAPAMHRLLARRQRALQAACMEARTEAAEALAKADALARDLQQTKNALADKDRLVSRLETQLAAATASDTAGVTSSTKASTARVARGASGADESDGLVDRPFSAESQLESLLNAPSAPGRGSSASASADTSAMAAKGELDDAAIDRAGGTSVSNILREQRDRYKNRAQQLEAELAAKAGEAAVLREENARLTADNVTLYGKTRFLQSALSNQEANSSAGGAFDAALTAPAFRSRANNNANADVNRGVDGEEDDFERPYRRLYSESIDPFADFRRKEKEKQFARLSGPEKITLTSSRLFLANRYARTFVFFYALVLHMLLFSTLWHFGQVSHGACDNHFDGDPSAVSEEGNSVALRGSGHHH